MHALQQPHFLQACPSISRPLVKHPQPLYRVCLSCCCAGGSELAVPEVFLPLQRCAETLSIGLDAASVRRMLSLCFRAAAPSQASWQVRQQAVLTVAALARAVRMEDPLFPGEGKLVSTPAVRWLQQERGAIMELLERVRYDKVRCHCHVSHKQNVRRPCNCAPLT